MVVRNTLVVHRNNKAFTRFLIKITIQQSFHNKNILITVYTLSMNMINHMNPYKYFKVKLSLSSRRFLNTWRKLISRLLLALNNKINPPLVVIKLQGAFASLFRLLITSKRLINWIVGMRYITLFRLIRVKLFKNYALYRANAILSNLIWKK